MLRSQTGYTTGIVRRIALQSDYSRRCAFRALGSLRQQATDYPRVHQRYSSSASIYSLRAKWVSGCTAGRHPVGPLAEPD